MNDLQRVQADIDMLEHQREAITTVLIAITSILMDDERLAVQLRRVHDSRMATWLNNDRVNDEFIDGYQTYLRALLPPDLRSALPDLL